MLIVALLAVRLLSEVLPDTDRPLKLALPAETKFADTLSNTPLVALIELALT